MAISGYYRPFPLSQQKKLPLVGYFFRETSSRKPFGTVRIFREHGSALEQTRMPNLLNLRHEVK
jgi:hypothetical protein